MARSSPRTISALGRDRPRRARVPGRGRTGRRGPVVDPERRVLAARVRRPPRRGGPPDHARRRAVHDRGRRSAGRVGSRTVDVWTTLSTDTTLAAATTSSSDRPARAERIIGGGPEGDGDDRPTPGRHTPRQRRLAASSWSRSRTHRRPIRPALSCFCGRGPRPADRLRQCRQPDAGAGGRARARGGDPRRARRLAGPAHPPVAHRKRAAGARGGGLGVGLAVWGVQAHGRSSRAPFPRADEIAVDGRVLAFALGLSVVTGLLLVWCPPRGWPRGASREACGREAVRWPAVRASAICVARWC